MAPAMRKDTHTAEPATAPAAPSSAKIPAPTMEPTPMNAAWMTVICFFGTVVDMASLSGVRHSQAAVSQGGYHRSPDGGTLARFGPRG